MKKYLKVFLGGCFVVSSLSTIYAVELNSTNITQAPFNCPASATSCNLSNRGIKSLATGTFDNHTILSTLSLSNNQISTLSDNIFASNPNLYNLDLSDNQISSLPENIFANNPDLSDLSLNYNQISSLPENIFANNPDLSELYLNYNQISSLPESIFANNSNLFDLRFRHNQISSLPESIFANNSNLYILDLRNNQISILPENIFSNNLDLYGLRLENNQIGSLPENIFLNNTSLNNLSLNYNKLKLLPSSLLAIPVNQLYADNNCLLISTLSSGQISYLNTYADDNPAWHTSQNRCLVDFTIGMSFPQLSYPGLFNILQIYVSQGQSNQSTGNFVQLYGLDDLMTVSLIDSPGWIVSGGVYRYDLPDFTDSVSTGLLLSGVIHTDFLGGSPILTGIIYSSATELSTGNNIYQYVPYIYPAADYVLSGPLGDMGQYGDIKNLSLNYDVVSPGLVGSDGILIANLGSGVSILSTDWSPVYASGGLFMSGDICYDVLMDEVGPYYNSIKDSILPQGYSSIDAWLVDNYGYVSDITQEMENMFDLCMNQWGYISFAQCLRDSFSLEFSKTKYPQCGGPKSFVNTNDVCYNQFYDEQGEYYNALEQLVISWGYTSLDEWLVDDGYVSVSDPIQAGERIVDLCINQWGYSTFEQCLLSNFSIDVTTYSTCGYNEISTLFAKLFVPFSGTIDLQIQIDVPLETGNTIESEFIFFPSLLDYEMSNNRLNYTISALVLSGVGVAGGGGGTNNTPIDNCPKGDYSASYYDGECIFVTEDTEDNIIISDDIVSNDTISDGYCYRKKSDVSIINSKTIKTTAEFKQAMLFLLSYDMTMFEAIDDFEPYRMLRREEAAKIFSNFAINVFCRKPNPNLMISYSDVALADSKLKDYISLAYQLGLMKGGSDGKFRPKDMMTRVEFNATLIRMILNSYLPEDNELWYKEYNNLSKELGIMNYISNNEGILRSDASLMLLRSYKNQFFTLSSDKDFVIRNRDTFISMITEDNFPSVTVEEIQINNGDGLNNNDQITTKGDRKNRPLPLKRNNKLLLLDKKNKFLLLERRNRPLPLERKNNSTSGENKLL